MNRTIHIVIFLLVIGLVGCDTGLDEARITDPPESPELVSPTNPSGSLPNAVSLRWRETSGASTYHVQLSTSGSFSQIVYGRQGLIQTSEDVRELELGTNYYWRVRAENEFGTSDWSDVGIFAPSVEATTPPIPQPRSPNNNAMDQSPTILFEWDGSSEASSYQIQVSLFPTFYVIEVDISEVSGPRQSVFGLVHTYVYYWRVRSYNPAGYSSWSNTRVLEIEDDPELFVQPGS